MTSRERLFAALRHRQPDRVPFDLGSTQVTTISVAAYEALRDHLGLAPRQVTVCDTIQQAALPDDDLLDLWDVDTRGLFPLTSANWHIEHREAGDHWLATDEWGLRYTFPKHGGHYYSLVESPLAEGTLSRQAIEAHRWPQPRRHERIAALRQRAEAAREEGKVVVLKGFCAGLVEMGERLRGMEPFLCDLMLDPQGATRLMRKVLDLKLAFWELALDELGDVADVVLEADDFGTQESLLVPPRVFRSLVRPLLAELMAFLRQKLGTGKFILFHSCGSVRDLIPDFIDMGIDALNPVHVAAAGMEPAALKRDFGRHIAFWGGGVDTQGVLPTATPQQVRDDVRRNVEALAPDGGYVFTTVHNVQPDVPPQNLVAMWEALQEFGAYY
ncbi:MAG: uroporphyrinogen decarboxylase family protein [Candidatus Brocadiia bacterium]